MSTWLVRHSNLTFERPVSKDKIIEKIESGEILAQDEICEASSYWFSIQENEEVIKHFGNIRLQALMPDGNDVTSATNTTPLSQAAAKVIQEVKNRKPEPLSSVEPERKPGSAAFFWGAVLAFIFFGTLMLLWRGSH